MPMRGRPQLIIRPVDQLAFNRWNEVTALHPYSHLAIPNNKYQAEINHYHQHLLKKQWMMTM